jgi:MSHA biogenesis protein MshG
MSRFHYRARRADGAPVQGEIEAGSASAAAALIQQGGLVPVEIGALQGSAQRVLVRLWRPRVRTEELVMLCRQLYTLQRAGVPLVRSLSSLAQTARNRRLSQVLDEMAEALSRGRGLGQAMEAHADVFPRLLIGSVQLGENTGRLEETFRDLAAHLDRESQTIRRIKSASRYPMLVVGALVIAIAVINVFVMPAFSGVFKSFQTELPLPTRILIGTSDFTVKHGPLLLFALAGGALGLRAWLRTDAGRYRWHRLRLRLPVVGRVLAQASLARFARGYAMSSRAGAPIMMTLRYVGAALDDAYLQERVAVIGERIERGETLTAAATASGLFPPLVLQMIAIGEESGSVDELLDEVAGYYEREVDYDLKRLSDSIEPLLIAGLGVVVLVLALGVYLPLWDLAQAAKSGA